MVQLKEMVNETVGMMLKFQYLMVQLKARLTKITSQLGVKFQYLMVQLKGFCVYGFSDFYGISIPHGTIKRSVALFAFSLTVISIPHGTIKSWYQGTYGLFQTVFQYLMVQLKARLTKITSQLGVKFQYLMVQLKDSASI